ncbi:response regulator [Flavobacterium ustbae]|uniref:response regulator n=1 Tax=Flavobacterium ustbae TaxID=2488790 RepID=UPI000F7A57B1|nr:response regulator [Flavobacterium ustbae]
MLQLKNFHKFIFHADDDEDDRLLFLDAVDELDLHIRVGQAADGGQLLQFLRGSGAEMPELLFLDINMPGKNGFECLREIKGAGAPFGCLKIIMLSTSRNPENIDLSYALGADLYAVKPATFQELKKLLWAVFMIDWSAFARDKKRFILT